MKKKLGIALALILLMVLVTRGAALAWDNEDPEVANNSDFVVGTGVDVDAPAIETHVGGQLFSGDGHNLYRDDVTDTGNLDVVVVTTFTPNKIDLPGGFFIWKTGASSNTWYWASGARGTDNPARDMCITWAHYLHIYLPDGDAVFRYDGKVLRDGAVDFCDGTWRIQIPAGAKVLKDNGARVRKLFVDENGLIVNEDVNFIGGEVTITPCLHQQTN